MNWLPPLVDRIADDRSHLVAPIIDVINPSTLQYTASPLVKGGFNWGLNFKWDSVPKEKLMFPYDFTKPIK